MNTGDQYMRSREEFESWCSKRWGGDRGGLTLDPDSGGYVLSAVQFAWSAWSARDARIAELEAGPLRGKYGEVLAPFVAAMEHELHANAAKGDRPGWLRMAPDTLLLEIYWHTAKLSVAVRDNDAARIREHSADVANMAMMLLDVCVGLTGETKP